MSDMQRREPLSLQLFSLFILFVFLLLFLEMRKIGSRCRLGVFLGGEVKDEWSTLEKERGSFFVEYCDGEFVLSVK